MYRNKETIYLCAGLLAAALAAPPAKAIPHTFVSGSGSDSNACTRIAPCLTFIGAIAKTDTGGQVDAMDVADYGVMAISQSITIDGHGMATIHGTSDFGLISVTVTDATVTLRGLSLNVGDTGVVFNGSGSGGLHLEDIVMTGLRNGLGIALNARYGGDITIKNVVIENGTYGIGLSGTAKNLTIDNLFVHGMSNTGLWLRQQGALTTVTIRNSDFSDCGTGIYTDYGNVALDTSLVSKNLNSIQVAGPGVVRLTNDTIVDNVYAPVASLGGAFLTFVNNRIWNNTYAGSSMTSVYQK